ncbi:MAG: glycosyltransferase family 39 protein, partial [Chloroflexota bacterium]
MSRITDPHPPLYYLILHPWQSLVSEKAWAMRFAGVMASSLSVAALYTLARKTGFSTTISLFATFLLAINPFQIWLAQDVRSYPFFTLLGLLSSLALWQALHRRQSTDDTDSLAQSLNPWLIYITLTVACFYIHYYTIFLVAFQGLFVLINARHFWRDRWVWLVSQLVIGGLMIPGLQLAYNFLGQAAGGIEIIPTPKILQRASTALLTGFTLDANLGLWLSLLLAPLWMIGLGIAIYKNSKSGTFWGLFFIIPVLGVISLSINRPFFKERYLVQAQ